MHSPVLRLTLLLAHASAALFGRHARTAQDLTDTLAGQAEHFADLAQGLAVAVEAADDGLAFKVSFGSCHVAIKPWTQLGSQAVG